MPAPRDVTASPDREAPAHPTAILAIICISYFMGILDNSIIFTGLPRIESAMRFTPTGLTWVQDAYTLVFGGLLLLGARAGDILGRRRVFVIGLVLFGMASFLVGAAPYAWWLIAARAVQGVGAAILAPSSLALLTASFEGHARATQPIMPLRLFADRRRVGAYLVRMLYLGAMIGFFYFTTQYLQGVLGFSPLQAGLAFLPMSAVNFAVALLVMGAVRRLGSTPVLALGVLVTLAGMGWLSRVGADSSYPVAVALPMVLIGIGQGLAFAPMTSAGLAGVDPRDAGAASGMVNTFHQLGSALGLGILVAVGVATVPTGTPATTALVDRVGTALAGGSVMLAIALVLVGALITERRPQPRIDERVLGPGRPEVSGPPGPRRGPASAPLPDRDLGAATSCGARR